MLPKNILTKLFTVASCLFIFSCQPDTTDELPVATNKVKTYTEDITRSSGEHEVTTFNLNYDGSNRIISTVSASDPGFKFVYSYPSANVVIAEVYDGGVLGIHSEEYFKDNHIDSAFEYNDTQDSTTVRFIFNSSGDWIKKYDYDYSKSTGAVLENTTSYTYDSNGNQSRSEDTDGNVETYEYYTDKVYVFPLIGPSLIPIKKRALVRSYSLTSNGSHDGTVISTYEFDSNDRISASIETEDDGSIVRKTFTYF